LKARKSKPFDITKKLKVSAPDSTLYAAAEKKLGQLKENPSDLERKEEFEKMEGILWARFRQLKNWTRIARRRGGSEDSISELLSRKRRCLTEIDKLRKALGKEKMYGFDYDEDKPC